MAWLWQTDIDDEKRTPGIIFRLKSMLSRTRLSMKRAEHELRSLRIEPGQSVLDFGCGPGQYSIAAARLVGENGTVQALDLHPTALEMVEKKADKMNLNNVDTIYSDLETGLDPASVDAVLLFDILPGRKDVRNLLNELHRVLKPDGTVHVRGSGLRGDRLEELMVKDGFFTLLGRQEKILNFGKVVG